MTLPSDPLFLANLLLLLAAFTAAIIISAASVRYRRNIGDTPRQHVQKQTILHSLLLLIVIGLIAAGFNLIFA